MIEKVYTAQFKFLEVDIKSVSNGLMTCIDYLESKGHGFKTYGRCSTFKTTRVEVSSFNSDLINNIVNDLKEIFENKNYPVKVVIYSVVKDVVEIHKIHGDRDDDMVSVIISVKNTTNPIN